MDKLDVLLKRNSSAKLSEPAPAGETLQIIFQAALRAPDHARLKPWRHLVIEGDARHRLGELFASVALAEQPSLDDEALVKIKAKALRAPLLIVVVARLQQHPKVPAIEQYLSAGAAAHAMLLAADAQGFAGIWRTGSMAFNRAVMTGLGLAEHEHIVGFVYLGTREGRAKPLPEYSIDEFFERW
jgi:nitroreductase